MPGEREWQRKFVQKKLGQSLLYGTWRCVDLGRRNRSHVFWGKREKEKVFTLPISEDMAQGMAILGHCNAHEMSELIWGHEHLAWVRAPNLSPAGLSVPLGFIEQFSAHAGIQHMATMH